MSSSPETEQKIASSHTFDEDHPSSPRRTGRASRVGRLPKGSKRECSACHSPFNHRTASVKSGWLLADGSADQPRRGRRPRSSKSERGRTKPGKTAPPSSAWSARTRADFSIVEKTRAVRFLGSISQTSMTPASKYSRTLRAISGLVFPSLSTSTARSGARSGIGSRGLSRPGSLLPGDERQIGNPHQAGSDPHHAVGSNADSQVVLIEIRTDQM